MKFSDISNERTVLDEGAWSNLKDWLESKTSGLTPDDIKMRKGLELNIKEMNKVARLAFPKGEAVEVEQLHDFFHDLGYGKSGAKVVKEFESNNVIKNNTLPYNQLEPLLARVIQTAIAGDATAFVKKAGIGLGDIRGREASVDVNQDKEAKQKEQKEVAGEIIEKMGDEFRKIINDSDDEDLRAIRFQAYRVFRQVAEKYGKHLDEPPSISPGFQNEG